MVLEGEFIAETIFGGFVSKVVNNIWDVSWEAIKTADKNRADKDQSFQARIYQIIIDVLNMMTHNRYKGKDIIYDTAEKLLEEFKINSNYNDAIKCGMKNFLSNIDDSVCKDFIRLLFYEFGEEKNFDLYKEILLLLVNEKNNHTNEELQLIQRKLDYVIQKLNEKNVDRQSIRIQEESHQIKSRTQEYADKWNKNMFLNDFSEWDEKAGVNVKLKDVYIDEHLPHFIWGTNEKESENLDILLSKYIGVKKETKMLLILGLPGIGKSTLITWITTHFNDRIDDILVYKFSSDLSDIDWQSDMIITEILEKLELSYDDLNNKTIILDGFDEINVGDNRKDILDNLYDELAFRKIFVNFSLIITCRENYIQEIKSLKCNYITLQSWNEEQITSFCMIFQDITKNMISEFTINEAIINRNVFGIPLILYMILSLNISIGENGSTANVYDKIFSLEGGIYDRCIGNKSFADKHRISRIKIQIHQISREIALWMFENNPNEASIPQEEYRKICIDVEKNNNEKTDQDFLIGSYFKLVKHCEGVETKKICFVHRSIYEYFVAEYIFTSMQNSLSSEELAGILGTLLKGNVLSNDKEIIFFLTYYIKKYDFNNLFQHVKKTFNLMINNGMTYYTNKSFKCVSSCESIIFANMMEIMHFWDIRQIEFDNSICDFLIYNKEIPLNLREVNLKGKNLEFANLAGANLAGANLNSVNLRSANLKGAFLRFAKLNSSNLQGANLVKAELMGAKLVGADLARANLKGANLSGANLLSINLSGADLRNAQLKMTKLVGANLSRADLRKAHLSRVELNETKLTGANISNIVLEGLTLNDLFAKKELLITNQENEYKEEYMDDEYWIGRTEGIFS